MIKKFIMNRAIDLILKEVEKVKISGDEKELKNYLNLFNTGLFIETSHAKSTALKLVKKFLTEMRK